MKVRNITGLVDTDTMTREDFECLAYIINNYKRESVSAMVRHTGYSKFRVTALMRTFGLDRNRTAFASVGKEEKKVVDNITNEARLADMAIEREQMKRSREFEHKQRLEELKQKVNSARRLLIVSHPYKIHPSLGVSEWEQAMFDYYKELYLWE